MQDYLHNGNNANFVGTVTFGGLTPGGIYDLYLYGLGDQTNQSTDFFVAAANGGATGSTTGPERMPYAEPDNYVSLLGVIADASGNLTYTWGKAAGGYARHNGVQLVEVRSVIPEPSTLAIWGLGLLVMVGWRRSRK